ncbi:hypothetical protein [Thalassotalea maritima]|uniref:hypothetical protein n=1 Tax=Thalassotalea maritima TaxID=3242416 RepID=UPI003527C4CC
MERLKEAQQRVLELYSEYAEQLNIRDKVLDIDDVNAIEKAFNAVYQKDAFATRTKTRFPRTLTQNLRTAFADLLLLMDGKDIKQMKHNKNKSQEEEEE